MRKQVVRKVTAVIQRVIPCIGLRASGRQPRQLSRCSDYGLDYGRIMIRFLAVVRESVFLQSVETGFGTHPASCAICTGGSCRGKAAEA